ncbi:uncharacterized protein AMSG_07314 [Thecamonas trahens ATCC 50062]|uniref:Uncharacterized protein n=1 Tax=Thecamonas trahens ATCC 50062 TaxID=461836 RepID=A0A0L0DJ00_THETB|nr:hypothetical protein AMSG_07314 [Thecamonas trahens ATCC 50062]KNC51303.1 hypothetical protein AMSG_07314 [Thecamonas trahens ATCC 50062]|eukprot:XP_013756225.1 hypothetical protein AMSG_07314 [Thecamonas trahens ATCC 50062]
MAMMVGTSSKGRSSAKDRQGKSSAKDRKDKSSAKSRKGKSSAKSRKGKSSAKSRKGKSSAKSRKGKSSAEDRKGKSSAKDRRGKSSAKDRKGKSSAKSRKGKSPAKGGGSSSPTSPSSTSSTSTTSRDKDKTKAKRGRKAKSRGKRASYLRPSMSRSRMGSTVRAWAVPSKSKLRLLADEGKIGASELKKLAKRLRGKRTISLGKFMAAALASGIVSRRRRLGLWAMLATSANKLNVHELDLYVALMTGTSAATMLAGWARVFDRGSRGLDAAAVRNMFVAAAVTKTRCDFALPGIHKATKSTPLRFAYSNDDAQPFLAAADAFFARAVRKTASSKYITADEFARMRKAKELGPIVAYFTSVARALPSSRGATSSDSGSGSSGSSDSSSAYSSAPSYSSGRGLQTSVFVDEVKRPRGARYRRDHNDTGRADTRSHIRSRAREYLSGASMGGSGSSSKRASSSRKASARVRRDELDDADVFHLGHWADLYSEL